MVIYVFYVVIDWYLDQESFMIFDFFVEFDIIVCVLCFYEDEGLIVFECWGM